jgi:hypothetical protein
LIPPDEVDERALVTGAELLDETDVVVHADRG